MSSLPSGRRASNPRPSAWEADALPTELRPRDPHCKAETVAIQCIAPRAPRSETPAASRAFLRSGKSSQRAGLPPRIVQSCAVCVSSIGHDQTARRLEEFTDFSPDRDTFPRGGRFARRAFSARSRGLDVLLRHRPSSIPHGKGPVKALILCFQIWLPRPKNGGFPEVGEIGASFWPPLRLRGCRRQSAPPL